MSKASTAHIFNTFLRHIIVGPNYYFLLEFNLSNGLPDSYVNRLDPAKEIKANKLDRA